MINKYISSKTIIEKIYDEFNIQSDDFVTRVATWTLNVLKTSKIKQAYVLENILIDFSDYRICIPQKVDRIYEVSIDGYKAIPSIGNTLKVKTNYSNNGIVFGFDGTIYPTSSNIIPLNTTIDLNETEVVVSEDSVFGLRQLRNNTVGTATYKINNGWIHTNIEHGTCEIACGSIPYVYDEDMDTIFPLIPDDENLFNAIMYYCLKNILQRGYHHPVLNLTSNNHYTNPALAYEKYSMKARNSCNALSPSVKKSLSSLLNISLI